MEQANAVSQIKKLLSQHLGIDPEDLNNDDSFSEDLHMTPSDLSDFIASLGSSGFDTSSINIVETETIGDLFEALDLHE